MYSRANRRSYALVLASDAARCLPMSLARTRAAAYSPAGRGSAIDATAPPARARAAMAISPQTARRRGARTASVYSGAPTLLDDDAGTAEDDLNVVRRADALELLARLSVDDHVRHRGVVVPPLGVGLVARHLDAVDLHGHVFRRRWLHPFEVERAADDDAGDLRKRGREVGGGTGGVVGRIHRAGHAARLCHVVQRDLVLLQLGRIPGLRERDADDRHLDAHGRDFGDRGGAAREIVGVGVAAAEQRVAARAGRLPVGREQDDLLLVA